MDNQITGYNIYRGESGEVFNVPGFISGTNLLDVVQNISPDESPMVNLLRNSRPANMTHHWTTTGRSHYIEDNNGMCMCYKHRRIWREGADYKLGRRPRIGPGGACKECCLKSQI